MEGTMRSVLLGAILAATAPAAVDAQTPHPAPVTAPKGQVQAKAAIAECDGLIAYLEQSRGATQGFTVEQVRAWREALNPEPRQRHLERLMRTEQTRVTSNASESSSPAIALPATAAGTMPTEGPPETGALPGIIQQSLKVSDFEARRLYGAGGTEIGSITKLVSGPEDRKLLVVNYGGFLNLGGKEVAIPIDQVTLRDDRLVALKATYHSLKDAPEFEGGRAYRELNDDDTAIVRVLH
jgi:hypothetical protein